MKLAVALGCFFTASASLGQFEAVVVAARSGSPVSGAPSGVSLAEVGGPLAVSENGIIAARAVLAGPGVDDTNDNAIIRIDGSDVQLVAREGDQVPGLPTDTLYRLFNALNAYTTSDGAVVFSGFLGGSGSTGGNDAVVARFDDAGTTVILRKGAAVPGLPSGTTLETVGGNMGVSPNGATAQRSFTSEVVPDFQMTAIVLDPAGDGSGLEALARVRGPAPGFPGMTIFWLDSVPQVDAQGRAVFPAVVGDLAGFPFTGQGAVFAGDANGVVPVAADGWGSTHFPPGTTYGGATLLRVNQTGGLAFLAGLVPSGDKALLLQQDDGDPVIVLRTGDQAPDAIPGVLLSNISINVMTLSDSGAALKGVLLEGPGVLPDNDGALVLAGDGFARMIAREGDPVPGQVAGTTFKRVSSGRFAVASHDRVVFRGVLNDDRPGLYLGVVARQPEALFAAGDSFDIADTGSQPDVRTVADIGPGFSLNAADQVAVEVTFADGTSAILRGQLPAICLPDTNNDGMLTPADFNAWVIDFNTNAPECDQNNDGLCSPADFNAWVVNFNAGC
ncbi:MAG: choice-of-anchor tandem repeat NxxGxxAF-containing protein [Planctomycetota bacterium]